MSQADDRVLRFLKHVHRKCAKYGVALWLPDRKVFFLQNQKLRAYFENPTKDDPFGLLAVAFQSDFPEWLHHLVHEYAHFTQWTEQSPLWILDEVIFARYSRLARRKKRIPNEERALSLRCTRAIELDCEKRAVMLIKKWELPLDVGYYIQFANARAWCCSLQIENATKGRRHREIGISLSPSVLAQCPKEFLTSYDDIPDFFRAACGIS